MEAYFFRVFKLTLRLLFKRAFIFCILFLLSDNIFE
jgi:hypothetical protein